MKKQMNILSNKWLRTAIAVAGTLLVTASSHAFPTWMGVYGQFERHDGNNPGTFTVLMNQSYDGLEAQVGIRVNGEYWLMRPMAYSGDFEGNSVWSYTPANGFPPGSTVEYFFYGYDSNGGQIWDSNNSQNYSFTTQISDGPLAFEPKADFPLSEDIFYLDGVDMAAYDGTLYAIWSEAGGVPGIRFSSKPEGGNWSSPVNLSDSGWKAKIAASAGGVHVTYDDYGKMVYVRSQDQGQTWSAPVTNEFSTSSYQLEADEDYVHMVYIDYSDGEHIYHSRMSLETLTWEAPHLIFEGTPSLYWSTHLADFRVHGSNLVLCSYDYFYRMGGNQNHAYRESTDGGLTWTETTPEGATYLQADIGSDGTVYMTHGESNNPDGSNCYFYTRSFGGTWSSGEMIFEDSGASGISALDDQLVALGGKNGQLFYRISEDNGATWSDIAYVPVVSYITKDIADGNLLHLFVGRNGSTGAGSITAKAKDSDGSVVWFGDTFHWPFDGEIDSNEDFWVNTYSYPQGAAASARVVYSSDNGNTWSSIDMELGGQDGDDDWWHVNLGQYAAGTTIQYAIEVVDQAANSHWHKDFENGGQDYYGRVNGGAYTYWVGNTVMFSQSGAPVANEEIWLSTETWPKGGAVVSKIWYTADGGANWQSVAMKLVGEIGNNDRFHYDMSLLGHPAGTTIQYAIQVIDGFGNAIWDSNGGSDYYITLE